MTAEELRTHLLELASNLIRQAPSVRGILVVADVTLPDASHPRIVMASAIASENVGGMYSAMDGIAEADVYTLRYHDKMPLRRGESS